MERPEIYYSILNIIDFLALTNLDEEKRIKLYEILDDLLELEAWLSDQSREEAFEAIADANDAGGVKNWEEMVNTFAELIDKGDRITC